MNPATLLKNEFKTSQAQQVGEIVSLSGTIAQVKTPRGVIECKIVDSIVYGVGQNVIVRAGVVVSRVAPESSVAVYRV